MGESKPAPVRPPKLPDAAPQDLRDFVACKRLDVVLRLDQLGWLPRPPLVPESLQPTVTLTPGSTPNSAEASIGWDIFSLTLPVSINSNGQLQVDTTNVPDLEGMRSGIDGWVKRFNDSLAGNGKRLGGLEIKGQEVRLTKTAVGATPGGTAITPTTPGTTQPPKPLPPSSVPQSPVPTPSEGFKPGKGCIAGLLGSVLVIGMAVGAFFALSDDDTPAATPPSDQISQPAPSAATQPAPSSSDSPTTDSVVAEPSGRACGTTVEQVVGYTNLELAAICLLMTEESGCLETGPDECAEPTPMAVFGGDVGITHDGSVPDAVTGQPGPSQAEFQLFVITQVLGSMRIASNCSGTLLTGESPVEPGAVTIVRHPFRQFGPCTVEEVTFTTGDGAYSYPPSVFGDNGAYTVDGGVVAPGVPPTPTFIASGAPLGSWFYDGVSMLAALSGGDDLSDWKYRAAVAPYVEANHWNLLAYAGGDMNALGEVSSAQSALDGLSLAPLFAGEGEVGPFFPCGPGQVGFTACPPDAAPFDSGGLVVVSVVNDAPIPLFPDEVLQLDFDFGGSGGPLYSVMGGADGWTIHSAVGATNARAVVRGNSLTFVVPPIELGGARDFAVRTIEEANTITHPGAAISNLLTSPRIDLPGVPPPQATETIQQFFAELSASLSVGDASFALGRLAPLVTDVYGADQCAATLAGRINPQFNIVVIEELDVGPWDWILPSGESHPVADAVTVTIDLTTGDGITQRVDSHVIRMDNTYRWFTICE